MSKVGIIYKVTSPGGKVYIGQTIQTLSARKWYHYRIAKIKGHRLYDTKIYRAIRKYGNKLVWSIECDNVPVDNLDDMEIKAISKYDSYKCGYNATTGGYGRAGNPLGEKSRKKLSKKYTGDGNPFYGKAHSDETKRKMSESSKGQVAWNKNVPHTESAREKMSASQRSIAEQKGKLTWRQVRAMRKEYASGKYTYEKLARKYNITKGNVGHIIKKRIWAE